MRVVVAGLLMVAAAGMSLPLMASERAPQGESWDSIRQLPDWSGVWLRYHTPPGSAPNATPTAGASMAIRATGGEQVSFTPAYAKLAVEAAQAHAQQNMSYCLPAGTPGIMHHTVMLEYLFTPGRVTLLFEDGEVRRIYTDGRQHRPLSELSASYMGDSIGHWEADTLVVDTIGFPKGSLFENYGVLATRNSHLVERIVRRDADHMQIDSVISDPAIFAEPYTFSRIYKRSSLPMSEPACAQNNRDTGTTIDLTPPPEEQ